VKPAAEVDDASGCHAGGRNLLYDGSVGVVGKTVKLLFKNATPALELGKLPTKIPAGTPSRVIRKSLTIPRFTETRTCALESSLALAGIAPLAGASS
jgi:hypothetical protein